MQRFKKEIGIRFDYDARGMIRQTAKWREQALRAISHMAWHRDTMREATRVGLPTARRMAFDKWRHWFAEAGIDRRASLAGGCRLPA